MTQNDKIKYKLQKKESKKMNKCKNLKVSKDKIMKIAVGSIYLSCLLGEMIWISQMDIPNYSSYDNNKKITSEVEENNVDTIETQKNVKTFSLSK